MPLGPLRGQLERVDATKIEGWAHDPSQPGRPVELELLDNGIVVARFAANQHRDDLEAAGIAQGHCAFRVSVRTGWSGLTAHVIQVRRADDGSELPGSPATLAFEENFGSPLRDSLAAALTAIADSGSSADRVAALQLLVGQTDALLRTRAETDGTPPRADMMAFYERWQSLLPNVKPPVPRRPPEQPAALRRRALIVTESLADTAITGHEPELRTELRGLVRLGHDVTVVTGEPRVDVAFVAELQAEGVAYTGTPFTASVEEAIRRQTGLFDVVLLNRAAAALRYSALVRLYLPRARLLLRAGPLQSVLLSRLATTEGRPELAARANRARMEETIAAWSADAVLVASKADAQVLRDAVPGLLPHVTCSGGEIDILLRAALQMPGNLSQ